MTSPEPDRPERGSTGRALIWLIAGLLLLVGAYLYFRFGREAATVARHVM